MKKLSVIFAIAMASILTTIQAAGETATTMTPAEHCQEQYKEHKKQYNEDKKQFNEDKKQFKKYKKHHKKHKKAGKNHKKCVHEE